MYPHHSQPKEMTTKSPGNHWPRFAPLQGLLGLEVIPRAAPVATGEHIGFCGGVVAQPVRKLRLSSNPARSCGAFTSLKMISIYPQTYPHLRGDYAAVLTAFIKKWFWEPLFLDHNPKKFPGFVANYAAGEIG
jgi:hypothetical protein